MEWEGTVRPMGSWDLEQTAQLEAACFTEPWSIKLLRSGLDSSLDAYLVYEDRGLICGYCVLRILGDQGEIQRIAVERAFRRQGIARKLMDAMVHLARLRGVREMSLEVRESNAGARKLYEAYGFAEEVVRRGYYHSPCESAVIMWNRRI